MDEPNDEADELISELEDAFAGPIVAFHHASALAAHLYLVTAVADADTRVTALKDRFMAAVAAAGLGSVLDHQLDYAIRLAASAGELTMEEMYKLFAVLDEIYALNALGFGADGALFERLGGAVRDRFSRQAELSSEVRKSKRYPWNESRWWYQNEVSLV